MGQTASYAFNAALTGVESEQTGTVATPTFFPDPGAYDSPQSVAITSTTGAAIYYTTDGTTPTTSSTLYTGPITVGSSQTVKAIGVLAHWTNSAVGSAAYKIPAPTIAP